MQVFHSKFIWLGKDSYFVQNVYRLIFKCCGAGTWVEAASPAGMGRCICYRYKATSGSSYTCNTNTGLYLQGYSVQPGPAGLGCLALFIILKKMVKPGPINRLNHTFVNTDGFHIFPIGIHKVWL
jgi:hypothetical protein